MANKYIITKSSFRKTGLSISVVFLVALWSNLVYLPGRSSRAGFAILSFYITQFLSILAIPVTLFCLVFTLLLLITKKKVLQTRVWLLPFSFSISFICVQPVLRTFARNQTIKQAQSLIHQLENYRERTGFYPTDLSTTSIIIPENVIIGASKYQYDGSPKRFQISCSIPYLFVLNDEIVSYCSDDKHEIAGSMSALYATSFPNWKYRISD